MNPLFFALRCRQTPAEASPLPPGFSGVLWRPSWRQRTPPGLPLLPFAVWWAFHQTRVFANRDYRVFLIYDGARVVHRSCVFPGYFRFPFMEADDLQVGDTWTLPEYRGQGLARQALRETIRRLGRPDRRFWYLTESNNLPSIRVAQQVGFRLVGEGRRTHRCGLRILGSFELDRAAA
ncbi:MAG TPA: GNAT family protein [Candidatus Anammoximicrobium sp.]|nr:GNAT family protein [Candidatus Anammoximicrobium sp.]